MARGFVEACRPSRTLRAEPASVTRDARRSQRHRPSRSRDGRQRLRHGPASRGRTASPVVPQPPPVRAAAARTAPAAVPSGRRSPEVEPGPRPEIAAPERSRPASRHAPAPRASRPPAPPRHEPQPRAERPGLDAPVTRLPDVGPAFAQKLSKLGVETVRDLLYLLAASLRRLQPAPHHRQARSWAKKPLSSARCGTCSTRDIGNERKMVTARVGDGTGEIADDVVQPVDREAAAGRPGLFVRRQGRHLPRARWSCAARSSSRWTATLLSTGRLVPVYPLTEGLSVRWLRGVIKPALDAWGPDLPDFLPREDAGRVRADDPRRGASRRSTSPTTTISLAAAHRRLSFDEFLRAAVGRPRRSASGSAAFRPSRLTADEATLAPFAASLPFEMTGGAAPRAGRDRGRPGGRPADEPAAAGRRRLGQDRGGRRRPVAGRRQRQPGRDHGADGNPGRTARPLVREDVRAHCRILTPASPSASRC